VVVIVGVTITMVPVADPGIQEYVEAPDAVKVDELPIQIAVGLETAVTVGSGVTLKLKMAVFVQPAALVPERVYTVVVVGVTARVTPTTDPGLQV
jgi:hypothetical protein